MSDQIPPDLRYTKDHEWLRAEGGAGTVGVTAHAVEQLGDVTMVELPEVGTEVRQGEVFGTIESVKAVSDLFAPVSGRVTEVNAALRDHPEKVNDDAYGEGWMLRVRMSDPSDVGGLLTAADYAALLRAEER